MNEQELLEQLALLEPTEVDAPKPASRALTEVQNRLRKEQEAGLPYRLLQFMSAPRSQVRVGSAFAALLLILAFTFPGVRVAASELLSLFRVQNFTAVSISPEQLAVLEQIAESGLVPGEVTFIEQPGEMVSADSLAAAEASSGLTNVRTLPQLGSPSEIFVVDGGRARLDIDLAGARAILEAVNSDPLVLPDTLDGASVYATIPAGVEQVWDDDFSFYQSESPVVEYPDGMDTAVLGEALLRVLGLSAEEAQRLAQEIDWTSTLLLPIPTEFATFSEVSVNGKSGIGISSLEGNGSAIVWQEDGMMYMLNGETLTVEELLSFTGALE